MSTHHKPIHTVHLALQRPGPLAGQLVSRLTTYLAVLDGQSPTTIQLPFEQRELEMAREGLSYYVDSLSGGDRMPVPERLRRNELLRVADLVRSVFASIPEVGAALHRGAIERGVGLSQLVITAAGNELASVPFELAFPPGGWLAGGDHAVLGVVHPVEIVRRTPIIQSDEAPYRTPGRILFAWSESGDSVPHRAHRNVLRKLEEANAGQVTVCECPNATLERIDAALQDDAITHVHILAHGGYDRRRNASCLQLGTQVTASDLARVVCRHNRAGRPVMVTLMACDSATHGDLVYDQTGVAQTLHAQGIDWVVGSQFPLTQAGSVLAADRLFEELVDGVHPAVAVHRVRADLAPRPRGFDDMSHDWASLVLFGRENSRFAEDLARAHRAALQRRIDRELNSLSLLVGPPSGDGPDQGLPLKTRDRLSRDDFEQREEAARKIHDRAIESTNDLAAALEADARWLGADRVWHEADLARLRGDLHMALASWAYLRAAIDNVPLTRKDLLPSELRRRQRGTSWQEHLREAWREWSFAVARAPTPPLVLRLIALNAVFRGYRRLVVDSAVAPSPLDERRLKAWWGWLTVQLGEGSSREAPREGWLSVFASEADAGLQRAVALLQLRVLEDNGEDEEQEKAHLERVWRDARVVVETADARDVVGASRLGGLVQALVFFTCQFNAYANLDGRGSRMVRRAASVLRRATDEGPERLHRVLASKLDPWQDIRALWTAPEEEYAHFRASAYAARPAGAHVREERRTLAVLLEYSFAANDHDDVVRIATDLLDRGTPLTPSERAHILTLRAVSRSKCGGVRTDWHTEALHDFCEALGVSVAAPGEGAADAVQAVEDGNVEVDRSGLAGRADGRSSAGAEQRSDTWAALGGALRRWASAGDGARPRLDDKAWTPLIDAACGCLEISSMDGIEDRSRAASTPTAGEGEPSSALPRDVMKRRLADGTTSLRYRLLLGSLLAYRAGSQGPDALAYPMVQLLLVWATLRADAAFTDWFRTPPRSDAEIGGAKSEREGKKSMNVREPEIVPLEILLELRNEALVLRRAEMRTQPPRDPPWPPGDLAILALLSPEVIKALHEEGNGSAVLEPAAVEEARKQADHLRQMAVAWQRASFDSPLDDLVGALSPSDPRPVVASLRSAVYSLRDRETVMKLLPPRPVRVGTAASSLVKPNISWAWDSAYAAVLTAAAARDPVTGKDHAPVSAIATLFLDGDRFAGLEVQARADAQHLPGTPPATLAELQDAFPDARTLKWRRDHPETWREIESRLTTRNLLDGSVPLPIQRDRDGDLWLDLSFADQPLTGPYASLDVRARWSTRGAEPTLDLIELRSRKAEHVGTPVEAASYDRAHDVVRLTPDDQAWSHGLRCLRSAALLVGEVDVHLGATHLVAEELLAWMRLLPAAHPVRALLMPFLDGCERINRFGDVLIMGEGGLLSRGSGLGREGLDSRLAQAVGRCDWLGFAPRISLPWSFESLPEELEQGRWSYHRSAAIFWEVLGGFVEERLDGCADTELLPALQGAWRRHQEDNEPPRAQRLRRLPGCRWVWPFEQGSRDGGPHLSCPQTREDVIQLCRWALFSVICLHTWINDRPWSEAGGDLEWASFGLQPLDPPLPKPTEAVPWSRVAPDLPDAALQLVVGWILDQVREDTFEKADVPVALALVAAFGEGRGSARERLERVGPPLSEWRWRILN